MTDQNRSPEQPGSKQGWDTLTDDSADGPVTDDSSDGPITDEKEPARDNSPDDDATDGESSKRMGDAATEDLDTLMTLVGHFYRGQLDRETTWRTRLDRTTNWAVLVIATLLTWTFSAPENPHYILLIGILLVIVFLSVEAYRYRAYDVPRSRVRMLEEDMFAPMFDTDRSREHEDWRRLLSEDLQKPAAKVSLRVAIARRLRRVYLPLISILFGAWLVKLAVFQPEATVFSAAALPPVPGTVVVATVTTLYLALCLLTLWPQAKQGRREFDEERPEVWDKNEE